MIPFIIKHHLNVAKTIKKIHKKQRHNVIKDVSNVENRTQV